MPRDSQRGVRTGQNFALGDQEQGSRAVGIVSKVSVQLPAEL